MADVTLTYKGSTIAEMNDTGTKTLKTAGKYCEGDIGVSYVKPSSGGTSGFWDEDTARALIDRTSLISITFPSGINKIGNYAFANCSNLELTSLPESITEIDDYAFYSCSNLSLTSLPESITTIGNSAFNGCTGLTSITFKGTPTVIDSTAFKNCTNLTTINVPWAEGAVANAPWGATNATINYNYTE